MKAITRSEYDANFNGFTSADVVYTRKPVKVEKKINKKFTVATLVKLIVSCFVLVEMITRF